MLNCLKIIRHFIKIMEKLLKKMGFSTNEAKVYLACLEAGLSSAQDIARIAGLQRTTTYSVLGYLVDKGIVGKSKERGKTRFKAEPPGKLLALIQNLQREVQNKLPELEAMYNVGDKKPKVLFYEGKSAIQNVYDDTLREKPNEILEWNTDAYFNHPEVDQNYIAKRMNAGICAKRIAGEGSVWHRKHKKYDESELSETVIVPKNIFWPEIEVNIYNNKVAFMSYKDEMSLIVESKSFADSMRQVYNLSWIGAKSVEVKK